MAASKMASDGNSDIKRKLKDFLQSNGAQMDSAWTLLLHSIKFIKTWSDGESEADGESEIDRQNQKERERVVVF